MLEEAAKEGINVIFTFVYSRGEDDRFVKHAVRMIRSHGQVCFGTLLRAERIGKACEGESKENDGKSE